MLLKTYDHCACTFLSSNRTNCTDGRVNHSAMHILAKLLRNEQSHLHYLYHVSECIYVWCLRLLESSIYNFFWQMWQLLSVFHLLVLIKFETSSGNKQLLPKSIRTADRPLSQQPSRAMLFGFMSLWRICLLCRCTNASAILDNIPKMSLDVTVSVLM